MWEKRQLRIKAIRRCAIEQVTIVGDLWETVPSTATGGKGLGHYLPFPTHLGPF